MAEADDRSSHSREGDLDRLLEEYLGRIRQGERPTVEEYAGARPDLASDIRELFPAMEMMEELGSGPTEAERPSAGGTIPERIGDFRIVREVGRGGMGVVYEAMQESLGRRVALKVLPRAMDGDARALERFRREARAAARLHHTNIVPVFGVGEESGIHYYAMQFIEGQSLGVILEDARRSGGAGPARVALLAGSSKDVPSGGSESGSSASAAPMRRHHRAVARVGLQVAEALAYAHAQGILHRDIKPSNLLVDAAGAIWVTDFGLAKGDETESLTLAGDVVGTIAYLAPERLEGKSDARSDVYALGLTLHELLTLQPAFADQNRRRLLKRIAEETPPSPRRLDPTIPRDLETIVLTAADREPARRYPSASRLAADLRSFLAGQSIAARRSSRLERLGRWCRREPVLAALGALVLVLLLTIAVLGSLGSLKLRELLAKATGNLERASIAEGQLSAELRRSYLAQARASRLAGRPGRRLECLEAVRRAVSLGPSPEDLGALRDEAIAALALADLGITRRWRRDPRAAIAMAPSLESFAVTTRDGKELIICRAADGAEAFRLTASGATIGSLHFSGDGRFLAARLETGPDRLAVYDLHSKESVFTAKARLEWHGMGFDRSSRILALASLGGAVQVIDLEERRELVHYSFRPAMTVLAYHPAEDRIAFASEQEDLIRIAEARTGRTIASFKDGQPHRSLAWSPSGDLLAAGAEDGSVRLWDLSGEAPRQVWTRPKALELGDPVTRLCWNQRGTLLASYSWSSRFRLWDPESGDLLLNAEWGLSGFSQRRPDLLGITLGTNELALAEVAESEACRVIPGSPALGPVNFARLQASPDGRLLASARGDGIGLHDLELRRDLPPLAVPSATSMLFSRDGAWLFTGGKVGLQRWPLARDGTNGAIRFGPPEILAEVKGNSARWIAQSADSRRVAIIGDQGRAEIVVLDLGPDAPRKTILRPHHGVDRISLRPDGKRLASGTWLGEDVKIWDVESGALERTIALPDSAFVEFSPCGSYLAVMSPEACFLYHASTFELVRRIEKPSQGGFPGTAVFRADGKVLAITHQRTAVRLIDPASGKVLATLEGRIPSSYTFALHPDGNRIFVGSMEGRIHAWDIALLRRELAALGLDWEDPGR